jgi:peptidylprolyl isomerase domain and WD repeat-containing protein 1
MSDAEQDTSVLGKRLWNGEDAAQSNGNEGTRPTEAVDDDDDEEVGPMPMPVDGVVKKKRKGAS